MHLKLIFLTSILKVIIHCMLYCIKIRGGVFLSYERLLQIISGAALSGTVLQQQEQSNTFVRF